MEQTTLTPQPQGTPAQEKAQKKAQLASAIKLLPDLINSAYWGQIKEVQEHSQKIADIVAPHYPDVAKRIKRRTTVQTLKPNIPAFPEALLRLTQPRHGLDDVVLAPKTSADLLAFVSEQQRAEELSAFGLQPRHRILLHGAPGNGKTMLAEALALVLDLPFITTKQGSLIGSYLGETGKRIDSILEYASHAPCLLFVDEFDSLGFSRGKGMDVGEMRRITNQLLVELERLPHQCVFVAATNMAEHLDEALLRRFDFTVEIPKPTTELILSCARKELRAELTPGHDMAPHISRIGQMPFQSLYRAVHFCKRIRRDLALHEGQGIAALFQAENKSLAAENYCST